MGCFFNVAEEQVKYLQAKGLNIDSKEIAENYFLRNSFYHVMDCYGRLLMKDDGSFYEHATFDELAYLHIFDKEVKYIFYKAISEIEIGFKALISYSFMQRHSDSENAYLRLENYQEGKAFEAAELIAAFVAAMKENKPYDNRTANEKVKKQRNQGQQEQTDFFIRLFHELRFERAITFFTWMKEIDQAVILKYLSQQLSQDLGTKIALSAKQVISYLRNLSEFKERVLSGKTMLGFHCRENSVYCTRLHSYYDIKSANKRKDVYNIFIIMRVFLYGNQFALVNNSLRKRFKQLYRLIGSIDPATITSMLGFPENWHLQQCLPQLERDYGTSDSDVAKAVDNSLKKTAMDYEAKQKNKGKRVKATVPF